MAWYVFNRLSFFMISKKIKCININGGKFYFVPTSKSYNKVEVNRLNGDEYAYTETDALTMGYVKYKKINKN